MATKLEEAEEWLRSEREGLGEPYDGSARHAQAILDELARLRGEMHATVFVVADDPTDAKSDLMDGHWFLSQSRAEMSRQALGPAHGKYVYSVYISARKVEVA